MAWVRVLLGGLLAAAAAVSLGSPTLAYAPGDPSDAPRPFVPWRYAAQMPYGPFESGGSTAVTPAADAFLTLPFTGPHLVTSIFDHCSPNYLPDGRVCRYDGAVARAGFGADWHGYPRTAGGKNFLYYDGHDGLDYSLYYEPVLAAADGRVTAAGWQVPGCATCGFGQQVLIDHGNGFTTRYGHLSRVSVAVGSVVRRGEVLGISGNTGASTGEHLHFGVYLTSTMVPVDPFGWTGAAGADPWAYDAGNLWLGGAPRFAAVGVPAVSAVASWSASGAARVAWDGAGVGAVYSVMVSVDGGALAPWLAGVGAGSAVYPMTPGRTYWFFVAGTSALGWQAIGMTGEVGGPPAVVRVTQG